MEENDATNISNDYPTIEQVESDGRLASARTAEKNFGLHADMLTEWRVRGCPRLPGRRKIKAWQIAVLLPGKGGGVHTLWFYLREELATIAKRFEGVKRKGAAAYGRYPQHWRAGKIKTKWASIEQFIDARGREFISHLLAIAVLGVSADTLWRWRTVGCPYLGGRRLLTRCRTTPFGRKAIYYMQEELDEVVIAMGRAKRSADESNGRAAPPSVPRAIAFIESFLRDGLPHALQDIYAAALKKRVKRQWLIRAVPFLADLVREMVSKGNKRFSTWRLPAPAAAANAAPSEPAIVAGRATDQTPKPRGRPPGRDPEVVRREKEMLAAWDRGQFKTKAAAGVAHGFHRQDATKLINDHERRKCKK